MNKAISKMNTFTLSKFSLTVKSNLRNYSLLSWRKTYFFWNYHFLIIFSVENVHIHSSYFLGQEVLNKLLFPWWSLFQWRCSPWATCIDEEPELEGDTQQDKELLCRIWLINLANAKKVKVAGFGFKRSNSTEILF